MARKRPAEDSEDRPDKQSRKSHKKRSSLPAQSGWTLSRNAGGRILDIDPIFSKDGETILIPYHTSIRAFSTQTSLLLRELDTNAGIVTGLAAGSSDTEIFVSTSIGKVDKWDWTTGSKLGSYQVESPVSAITAVQSASGDEDVLILVQDSVASENESGFRVKSPKSSIAVQVINRVSGVRSFAIVYEGTSKLNNLQALDHGKLLVASDGRKLLVGQSKTDATLDGIQAVFYDWYKLDAPDEISCLDVRPRTGKKSLNADIAIGTTSGPIHLYSGIVSKLRKIAKGKEQFQPSVQKLHWHRYAVASVKFSRNASYLISGGLETVLCSWQLDTNKRQDLPHLTSPIRRLVISPNDSSYAVLLSNNSLIVLSTLDFEPTFATSGLILASPSYKDSAYPSLPAVARPVAVPGQLMFAVPSSIDETNDITLNATYLQTIDIRTGTQLEKQALTRTNATDRISDPSGKLIDEPQVTHLAVSPDGKWLATAEKWTPPSKDQLLGSTVREQEDIAEARSEVYLKFWKRNEDEKTWELSIRVDNPHGETSWKSNPLLDLVASHQCFYTIGLDNQVKTWRQKSRQRNNVPVKDKTGQLLTNWQCISSIALPPAPVVDFEAHDVHSAKLAVSDDDSLLVTALQSNSSTTICVVDTVQDELVLVRNDMLAKAVFAIAIVDRYLVMLSEDLLVWNLVEDRLQYAYALKCTSIPAGSLHERLLLATQSDTFAIAVPGQTGQHTNIAVFRPDVSEPLTIHSITQPIQGLFNFPSSRGFVLVDELAQIRQLAPPGAIGVSLDVPAEEELLPAKQPLQVSDLALRTATGSQNTSDDDTNGAHALLSVNTEDAITSAKLAEMFGQVGSLGVGRNTGIFERVAQLAIGRKT